MLKKLIPAACFLVSFFSANAQQKITMINGKEITITSFDIKDEWVNYKQSEDTLAKQRRVDRYDVFSISRADGSEKILYDPNPEAQDPSVDWVRNYIKGEQYAMLHCKEHWNSKDGNWKKTKVPWNVVGSFAFGFGSSYFSFWGIPGPAIYTTVIGRLPAKVPPASDINESLRNDEAFSYGYQKKKRNQRIRQGFISGMIGFAAGITTFAITR